MHAFGHFFGQQGVDHALAIDAQGQTLGAIEFLQNALKRFGDEPMLVAALANMYQRAGNEEAAAILLQRLRRP